MIEKNDKIALVAGLIYALSVETLKEERAVQLAGRLVELADEAAQELPVTATPLELVDDGDVARIEETLGERAGVEFREQRAHGAL